MAWCDIHHYYTPGTPLLMDFINICKCKIGDLLESEKTMTLLKSSWRRINTSQNWTNY